MTDIATKLARFAVCPDLPERALAVLHLSLLDWCAVAIAGRDEPVAKILRAQALYEAGAAQAGIIGSPQKVPARMAAMVNGATSHALDYDDTHFAHIGHPSVAVMPAALAVAELTGASGADFQMAALIGAEASIRFGQWLGRGHYQTGFHQTATAGAIGATLAVARLLQLDQRQIEMALGLVSTRASGLKSQFGTMGKPMNAGFAAANGVEAALLAQRGFESNPNGLEGKSGFGLTHHGEADNTAFDDIGQHWMFETVSHKYHACCHGLHAMLEALGPVLPVATDDITQVDVLTHPRWMTVCNIARPTTGLEAKFSYPMVAAMRLLGHDTGLPESFTDAICSDARIGALRDKIVVKADDDLSEMQAKVMIHMNKTGTESLFHDLDAAQNLVTRQARVRAKAAALLGQNRSDYLWQRIIAQIPPEDLALELTA